MEQMNFGTTTCRSGLDYFPGLMEERRLESIFQSLSTDPDAAQDSLALRNWFYEILRICRGTGEFMQAMAAARRFKPVYGKPVFNAPLAATRSHRLTLTGIHPRKPIPLHDHPGTWSAQMVLLGPVRIRQFDILGEQQEQPPKVYLRAASLKNFSVGDISTVMPNARNVHGLTATSANAVLLNLRRLNNTEPPNWYFPVDPLRWKEPLLPCHRVSQKSSIGKTGDSRPRGMGAQLGSLRDRAAA